MVRIDGVRRVRTSRFATTVLLAVLCTATRSATEESGARHPEDQLVWLQSMAKPTVQAFQPQTWNISVGGLVAEARYRLVKHIYIEASGVVTSPIYGNYTSLVYEQLNPKDPNLPVTLELPPLSPGQYRLNLEVIDEFPGLHPDDSFLAALGLPLVVTAPTKAPKPSNASADNFCPGACGKLPHGGRCKQKWLLIWGTGRSGTTTLLNMLNLLPGVSLTGENRMLEEAFALWQQFQALQSHGIGIRGSYQHGPLDLERFNHAMQHLFLSITPLPNPTPHTAPQLRGFKEIRFRVEHVEFLEALFPCARFVFCLRRDVAAQAQSPMYRADPDAARTLHLQNMEMETLHHHWGPRKSFLLATEEFDARRFDQLIAWLGFEDCRVTGVRHDNANGQCSIHNASHVALQGQCRPPPYFT